MTALSVKADAKGRVCLGKGFAGQLVLVEQIEEGTLKITKGAVIPARELWLHMNGPAFESVMRGLQETGRGEFAEPPDLEADAELADRMKG